MNYGDIFVGVGKDFLGILKLSFVQIITITVTVLNYVYTVELIIYKYRLMTNSLDLE